jgi:hypothetical protein
MSAAQKKAPAGDSARGEHSDAFDRRRQYTTIRPIDRLLPRLDGIKPMGDARWLARCPSHDDRRPSLSVRELDDHTLLLKCWSGCGAAEIVGALGLQLRDLFPPKPWTPGQQRKPLRRRWFPYEAMIALEGELWVAAILAGDIARRGTATPDESSRLLKIALRFAAAAREVGHG